MWSVGCILGELIVGKAIFQGTSTLNQIEKVLELIGKPKAEDIESVESPHAATILSSINVTKKKSFQSFFANASETALDFMRKLLVFNPNNRLTIEEALKHKYLEQFSSPEEEIVCDHLIKIPMDDNTKFTVKEYRDAIYTDIARKKKEQRKKMQEKYLSQLGVTPEMVEQSKLAKQQPSQGSGGAVPSSQSYSKPSQNTTAHQRTSSNQKNFVSGKSGEEEKNVIAAAEKRTTYAQSRPDSSNGTSDVLYQKAKAQNSKQPSAGSYASTNSTKTAAVSNNYVNQYASQVYASKPIVSQGSSGMGSTQYSKMSQSGTNFAKKK
jgi:mitogen-activated protein kinase 15